VGNLRPAIVCLAGFLVLLSITPLRRKVPLLRSIPAGVELGFWLGLIWLCATALASVQTTRSIDLGLATGRAAIYFAGQTFEWLLGSLSRWVAAHEPAVVVAMVGIVASSWLVIFARAIAAFRRSLEPRPRLGDWWVLRLRRAPRRRSRRLASAEVAALAELASLRQVDSSPQTVPRTSLAR